MAEAPQRPAPIVSRRDFVKTVGSAALAASSPLIVPAWARADGTSVEGAAFGGPIFYGHDATGTGNDDAKHTDNVWWYQGQQANAIFASLDDKEKAKALLEKGEPDAPRSIKLRGELPDAPG